MKTAVVSLSFPVNFEFDLYVLIQYCDVSVANVVGQHLCVTSKQSCVEIKKQVDVLLIVMFLIKFILAVP